MSPYNSWCQYLLPSTQYLFLSTIPEYHEISHPRTMTKFLLPSYPTTLPQHILHYLHPPRDGPQETTTWWAPVALIEFEN